MKISLNWLSDFIDITESDPQKIKDVITERTAEVETMESQGDHLEHVVVGKVTEVKKHPNADSLQLCQVSDGRETVQVVCGGSNVKEGMLCAFAKLGAVVKWHGGEVVKMEKAKIRGEESFGMICAAEEIGLGDMFPKTSEKEIVDLSGLNVNEGQPLAEALSLNDIVMDIDNHAITNRSDLFSHKGFSREFVANELGKWKSKKNSIDEIKPANSPVPIELKFQDSSLCRRYMGVYITDVDVKESPDWLKKRLIACGVNPISNLVDITNYVMLELGMPLHAFDLEKIKEGKWTMRRAEKGEKLITLDTQQHELNGGEIVLDDGNELFDLCGIMGGLSSGINQNTKKIWLHAPVYHPTLIRQGMRGLGHVSDAAIIYEKGIDPMLAEDGLKRAVELILDLCPTATVASDFMDVWNERPENREIELSMARIKLVTGAEIDVSTVEKIMSDLGFGMKGIKEGWNITVPSHRLNDVKLEADLMEEVARIYGFNNIPYKVPVKALNPVAPSSARRLSREMKEKLTALGFNEIYTFAFLGPELLKKCGMEVNEGMVEIINPLSSDMSLMRTSLFPRMMDTIADNLRYQPHFKLFELSKTYHRHSETECEEKMSLIMSVVGEDLRDLQGVVEVFGWQITPELSSSKNPTQHPGRVGQIMVRGKKVGEIYETHPQILKNFDIKVRVSIAEIDLSIILAMNMDARNKYKEISKYPSVRLDVSILIPKKDLAADYLKIIQKTDQKLIQKVELIDEYSGDQIPADKRSLTFSITYLAPDRTLNEKEVEVIHQQVLEKLKKEGAEIR